MQNTQSLFSKILFTIIILTIYRFGSFVPIPGINAFAMSSFASGSESGILGMFNMLSGGSLSRMSIFALAIMPYITSSIIIQLMSSIYKPLEDIKKTGEIGRKKINQITKYLTIIFASFQAYGVAIGLESVITEYGAIVNIPHLLFEITTVITLSVGTILLVWFGEQITNRGIGNGISLIIFTGIVSSLPSSIKSMFQLVKKGAISSPELIIIIAIILLIITVIVMVERAQRKVLLQYPKRQVGNKMYGGDSTHIPLKLNTSGVIPPIFASSLLLFPVTIAGLSGGNAFFASISNHLSHGKPLYLVLYIGLIIFFSFFYTAVVFNSEETADNLKRNGAYLPGYRPGKNTAEYFDFLLTRLTVIGSVYLSLICVFPELIIAKYSISFVLGGTSFLIIVNVVLDTVSQIQTHLFTSKYDSMVKRMKIR